MLFRHPSDLPLDCHGCKDLLLVSGEQYLPAVTLIFQTEVDLVDQVDRLARAEFLYAK